MLSSPLSQALEDLYARFKDLTSGEVATYIPELGRANPDDFAIAIATVDGSVYSVGAANREFTIQSISKPFVFGLALDDAGLDAVSARVGVEPSGEAFNAISLEPGTGRPRNPMINAGAIATTALIDGATPEVAFARTLERLSQYAGRALHVDEDVFRSEHETGHRNRAIGHLLRNAGILNGEVDPVVNRYFRQCSVLVNCVDLARMAATLASGGVSPQSGLQVLHPAHVARVLSVMSTCGMYDFSGSWVYQVGMPAKSGVAGGIIAVLPGQFGIGVYSPRLDAFGNSVRGVAVCEALSRDFQLHLLRPPINLSNVIRTACSLREVGSKRQRGPLETFFLDEHSSTVRVFELQGPLVLSTVDIALAAAGMSVAESREIIVDIRRASSVEEAACVMMGQFATRARERGTLVVYSGLSERDERLMMGITGVEPANLCKTLDEALEESEERILQRLGAHNVGAAEIPLSEHPLLKGLARDDIDHIEAISQRQQFSAGEVVFGEGEPGDSVYLIMRGVAAVTVALSSGMSHRVAVLGPGTSFGEFALLEEAPRSASVEAQEQLTCWRIPIAGLLDRSRNNVALRSAIVEEIARDLASRLRRANVEIAALVS